MSRPEVVARMAEIGKSNSKTWLNMDPEKKAAALKKRSESMKKTLRERYPNGGRPASGTGKSWWTDGKNNVRQAECPGNGWTKGRTGGSEWARMGGRSSQAARRRAGKPAFLGV